MIQIKVPRVVSEHPMWVSFRSKPEDMPVKMRDDLDPHDPPIEYASGRIDWSGYGSQMARDQARQRHLLEEVKEREEAKIRRDLARNKMRRRLELEARNAIREGVEFERFGEITGFQGPVVARDQKPAAHGCICVTEHANARHIIRYVNQNQGFREEGPWFPDMTSIAAEVDDELPEIAVPKNQEELEPKQNTKRPDFDKKSHLENLKRNLLISPKNNFLISEIRKLEKLLANS